MKTYFNSKEKQNNIKCTRRLHLFLEKYIARDGIICYDVFRKETQLYYVGFVRVSTIFASVKAFGFSFDFSQEESNSKRFSNTMYFLQKTVLKVFFRLFFISLKTEVIVKILIKMYSQNLKI